MCPCVTKWKRKKVEKRASLFFLLLYCIFLCHFLYNNLSNKLPKQKINRIFSRARIFDANLAPTKKNKNYLRYKKQKKNLNLKFKFSRPPWSTQKYKTLWYEGCWWCYKWKKRIFWKRLSAIWTRDLWINENYFSVCLSIADDSIYYYIYYFEERKKMPRK